MVERPDDWKLIVRYLSGESTPKELQHIKEKIAADPGFKTTLENVQKIWLSPAEFKKAWNVNQAWQQYVKQFGNPYEKETVKTSSRDMGTAVYANKISTEKKKNKQRAVIYRISAVAAAVAAVILCTVLFYNPQASQPEPVKKEIATKYGQRTHVRLSDGTIVTLNAGSKLILPEWFEGSRRNVELIGEAYFKVAPDPQQPFIIHAKNGIIQVLGTRFNVKAYPENKQLTVVVAEGKVALEAENRASKNFNHPVTKNHKVVLDETGNITHTKISDIETYLGWIEGKLIFKHASVKEVGKRLERWYAVKVQFNESIPPESRLTASFTAGQPLKEVLNAIALSLDLQYTKEKQSVTFSKN